MRSHSHNSLLCVILTCILPIAGCGPEITEAEALITPETLRPDLQALASDEMEGRGPGSPGGDKASEYLARRFQEIGLEPGLDGGYFQEVPIVGMTPSSAVQLSVGKRRGERSTLAYRTDFVAWAGAEVPRVALKGEDLVYVGYGIDAPEFGWDDFGEEDLKGKLLVMLVNDPPSEDPSFFGGKALTYYGRWTYKFEEAARRGAAGALLIHTDELAGYPWTVVDSSWTGEQFYLAETRKPRSSLRVEGWLTREAAANVFAAAGLDLAEMMRAAGKRGFTPKPLGLRAWVEIRSEIRRFASPNVVGVLRGSDPELADECVLFTSHYDHLGRGNPVDGDAIYNGALDNASGVATTLAVARAFATSTPSRSIVFAAVTAEESGLLGSQHYADHPVFPLSKTAATINLDRINVWGQTRNIVPLGADRSTLGEIIGAVAKELGMEVSPDPLPEKGHFFRSDHFSLAKKGVPAVFLDMGLDFVGKPSDWGQEVVEAYIARDYHQPSDEYDPGWSLAGAAQMGLFAYRVGLRAANAPEMPSWHEGDPFGRAREASLAEGS